MQSRHQLRLSREAASVIPRSTDVGAAVGRRDSGGD